MGVANRVDTPKPVVRESTVLLISN